MAKRWRTGPAGLTLLALSCGMLACGAARVLRSQLDDPDPFNGGDCAARSVE